jgi:hypothetical protein
VRRGGNAAGRPTRQCPAIGGSGGRDVVTVPASERRPLRDVLDDPGRSWIRAIQRGRPPLASKIVLEECLKVGVAHEIQRDHIARDIVGGLLAGTAGAVAALTESSADAEAFSYLFRTSSKVRDTLAQ